jgi:beta-mannosidase
VPWQFNESYPNAWCTAVVDHLGDPKPAYHAVAAAYGPAHVCAAFARQAWAGEAEFQAAVWAWSRDEPRAGCAATARVVAADGTVLAETSWPLDLPGGPAAAAGDVRVPVAGVPTDLFVLDLALTGPDGRSLSRNRYLFSRTADLAPLLDLAVAEVAAEVTADGDHWRVRLAHRSGPVAAGLRLVDDRPAAAAGWAVSAAPVDLLPGETRTVPVTWRGAEPAGRRLTLEGWNVRARALG